MTGGRINNKSGAHTRKRRPWASRSTKSLTYTTAHRLNSDVATLTHKERGLQRTLMKMMVEFGGGGGGGGGGGNKNNIWLTAER
jgi:hypothetical protein